MVALLRSPLAPAAGLLAAVVACGGDDTTSTTSSSTDTTDPGPTTGPTTDLPPEGDTDTDADTDSDTDTDPPTPPTGQTFDFHWRGEGYDSLEGLGVYMNVYAADDNTTPVAVFQAPVTTGMFDFERPDLFEGGATYVAYWYVDKNGDGICQDPGAGGVGDASWKMAFQNVSADADYLDAYDTNFDLNACNHL